MYNLKFFIYPVVGSFLGFITNFIAIKLLFRPRQRFLGIQGLLPKRKPQIALRAGEIVNGYLINSEDIRKKIDREKLQKAVEKFLEKNRYKLFELSLVRGIIKNIIISLLIDKDGYFNKSVIESFIDEGMVSGIVEQKINEFEVSSIEKLVKSASGPELNFIILTGAILGFIIGLVEAFIGL
jgi:uncharacterized membrane protein YheB (UPF0754 family)